MKTFKHLGEIFCEIAEVLKPALKFSVSEAAEEFVYLNTPGAYVGPFRNAKTLYMVEPQNTFASRHYDGLIFAGPAQAGKTASLILNPIAYSVKVEPMDMMIVCPTMLDGRDFSIRRLDRLNDYSTEIGSMMVPGASNDNTFDKTYSNGMLLTIGWPTRSQLAGKPIGRIVITDRDRIDDDIDGDGEVFDLASKRTTTFGSYAMTVAESSPSRPILNLKWIPTSEHEAPPCGGILGLYNRGDRRRWKWPCPHCGHYFEGRFTHLAGYVDAKKNGKTNLESSESVYMVCPKNGCVINPDDRDEMQFWGLWVKDGQKVDENGVIHGPSPRTRIASFWLNGVAAAFTSWKKLVAMYLDAMDHFERTGSEEALQKFYNNDLGEPYVPQNTHDLRLPEVLKSRAGKFAERKVPAGVRFLVGLADVQKNMWRCNVYGIRPGTPFDMVVIDRFDIRKSEREDHDGDHLWVKPHAHIEDWDQLTKHLLEKEYELDDDSGRMMGLKFVGCDVQGKEGVTGMAYTYYRQLREQNRHRRFILTRGDNVPSAPRARIHYPDSNRKDQKAAARGDIPVLFFNPNLLKDTLNGYLDCITPGKGMLDFPDWLPDQFYNEMCSEVRTEKGWENPTGTRNEDWDLSYMALGLCVSELVRVEGIDWESPPGWATDWDKNDLVRKPAEDPRFVPVAQSVQAFADFAKALA